MSEPAPVPVRKAALSFILITVALDILALGMIIPVLPHLFERFLGNDTALAARYYGYVGML
nr:tetracycline resistance MFS efflux pump [Xanthomonadales bacterium]